MASNGWDKTDWLDVAKGIGCVLALVFAVFLCGILQGMAKLCQNEERL